MGWSRCRLWFVKVGVWLERTRPTARMLISISQLSVPKVTGSGPARSSREWYGVRSRSMVKGTENAFSGCLPRGHAHALVPSATSEESRELHYSRRCRGVIAGRVIDPSVLTCLTNHPPPAVRRASCTGWPLPSHQRPAASARVAQVLLQDCSADVRKRKKGR